MEESTTSDADLPAPDPMPTADPERREFMQKAACVLLGGAATAGPIAAGVTVLVSPLFEEGESGTKVRLTTVDALAADAPPQLFKITAERKDAWTRHPLTGIGSVFLRRVGEGDTAADFQAFTATCPHLGCAVEVDGSGDHFFCPCHSSTFALSGEVKNADSPSPRGLDSLKIDVSEGEIWVTYENFKPNIAEKIPVS